MSAESGDTFAVNNPMSGAVIGSVPDMSTNDTAAAVTAAHEAFQTWRDTSAKER